MKDRKFALKFLQIAWVAETIAILAYTMAAALFVTPERVSLWLQFVPAYTILIGAQGGAAWAGPLISDKIKTGGKEK